MNPAYWRPVADHLWQSTLFAGAVALLTLALRTNGARVRHWLWLIASCKFLIPLSLLIALGGHLAWRTTPQQAQASLSIAMEEVSQPFTDQTVSVPLVSSAPSAQKLLPAILLSLWICGVAGIAFSWRVRWRRIRAIVRAGTPARIAKPIPARLSPTLMEPGVFGIFRPVLLLPEGIFERLTPAQLQAVVAHELCHVRYRDNLTAGIHMFVETLFWFHPMVWWIGKQMVAARERACDEEVLRLGSDPQVYAQGILDVCKLYLAAPLPCVSGVGGSDLRKRIEAILDNRAAARLSFTRKAALAGSAIFALGAPLAVGILNAPFARAQSEMNSTLQFEVASLKPAHPSPDGSSSPRCKGGPGTSDPGLFTCTDQVFGNLLAQAFDLPFYQLPNAYDGPRALYDISAKVPPGTTRARFQSMLQNLVIDRFRLKYHFEKKEMPVYNLVVAKGGIKMKESPPDPPADPDAPRPPSRSRLDLRAGKWSAHGVKVGQILGLVLGEVQSDVTDSTGLQGKYDFELTWTGRAAPPDDSGPTLLEALEQQLGIKVEQKKGQVDMLIVDHVEKSPIGN
jgi:uncharacterized protein (TIGR03435 family)